MFTYAQAEAVLARLHGISGDVQRRAFRARLKNLKRLGIPRGIQPGRGAKVWYENLQLYEWAFCLELTQFGLDPSLISSVIAQAWPTDIVSKFQATEVAATKPEGDLLFVMYPQVMTAAWSGDPPLRYAWVRVGLGDYASEVIWGRWAKHLEADRRAIVLNITALVRQIGLERVMVDSANAAARRSKAKE